MKLKKATGGATIGEHTWKHDGDVVEVPDALAMELLATHGHDFSVPDNQGDYIEDSGPGAASREQRKADKRPDTPFHEVGQPGHEPELSESPTPNVGDRVVGGVSTAFPAQAGPLSESPTSGGRTARTSGLGTTGTGKTEAQLTAENKGKSGSGGKSSK